MNRIVRIIKNLKKKEIQIIEKYITDLPKSKKKALLFSLLREEKRLSDEEIAATIFGKPSLLNLKKLEDRLLQDIEEVLILNFYKSNSENLYEHKKSNTIMLLLLSQYYLQNGLYSETYKKLRKAKRIISDHNFIFLESIYLQLYCDYLYHTGNKDLDLNLVDSIHVLSELQFIQNLKLNNINVKPEILKIENELLPVFDGNITKGDYSKCLSKLSQLKHLIYFGRVEKAELIFNSLLSNRTEWIDKIPNDMYADILLQKVKINILKEAFTENPQWLEEIRNLGLTIGNTCNEFMKMRFLNSFILGQYDICKSISFSFFSDKKTKGNITEEITNLWIYFNICLAFAGGQNVSVLKMISQFPGYNSCDKNLCLNIRLIELYLLIILDKEEIALSKLQAVKNILAQTDFSTKERYNYLINKLNALLDKQSNLLSGQCSSVSSLEINDQVPQQDYLGMEVVSFRMFESALKNKERKFQIAN